MGTIVVQLIHKTRSRHLRSFIFPDLSNPLAFSVFFTLGFFFLRRTRKNQLLFVLFFLNEVIMLHLDCLSNWNFLFLCIYQILVTLASVNLLYLLMYLCICVCIYLCVILWPSQQRDCCRRTLPSNISENNYFVCFFSKKWPWGSPYSKKCLVTRISTG